MVNVRLLPHQVTSVTSKAFLCPSETHRSGGGFHISYAFAIMRMEPRILNLFFSLVLTKLGGWDGLKPFLLAEFGSWCLGDTPRCQEQEEMETLRPHDCAETWTGPSCLVYKSFESFQQEFLTEAYGLPNYGLLIRLIISDGNPLQ